MSNMNKPLRKLRGVIGLAFPSDATDETERRLLRLHPRAGSRRSQFLEGIGNVIADIVA